MKVQLWKISFIALGAVVGVVFASSVQAQDPELFLISYPNAQINVDGDASDWNLDQFQTVIVGGMNPETSLGDDLDWERVTGTGDTAYVGFDDEVVTTLLYAGRWTGAAFPENPLDYSATAYARDNETHQYFLIDITDDEINTSDDAAWANDSVEFYIDADNSGGPRDVESDVQLVIDAANRVQVWDSSPAYKAQVEAGVTAVVTTTATGWMLEVGIDKSVFATPLPAILGPANDSEGNNYGIDFDFLDNDDPFGTGSRDPQYSSGLTWADPTKSGGFPSKDPNLWGQMIGVPGSSADFNEDGKVDGDDFLLWQNGFGIQSGASKMDGDFDNDEDVDGDDFLGWQAQFGTGVEDAGSSAVPEPAACTLLLLVTCGLLRRRRKS